MKILVLNCGSSSLKCQLIDMETEERIMKGHYDRIGGSRSSLRFNVRGNKTEIEHQKSDFEKAPNGVVGLETSLAATLTAFYHTGLLSLQDIIRLMSDNPRKLLRLPVRTLSEGQPADLILVDLNRKWTVNPEQLHSKSHNTVFKGMTFTGKVLTTITSGMIRYEDNH